MAAGSSEDQGRRRRLPRIKGWFFVLTGLAIGAGYLYYLKIEERQDFINSFYFRTLQEAATEFNNNLSQLETLHRYGQSTSTIQSIFTSYKQDESAETSETNSDALVTFDYVLQANRIRIEQKKGEQVVGTFFVDVGDLMPAPGNDFEIYVLADSDNRVLGGTGSQAGLSIINTEVISRAIQVRENQDWLKLATRQDSESPTLDRALPGYSTHIDVELNTGKSRVFVLPFLLFHEISIPSLRVQEDKEGTLAEGGVPMFLVGVQPDEVIKSYENKRWNFSLLLLSLVALVFMWTITRLLMLSRHQPLGNHFYRVTVVASYFTFVLLVALLSAFAHRSGEIELRQSRAEQIMTSMETELQDDLRGVFEALAPFHDFYRDLVPSPANGAATGAPQVCNAPGIPECDNQCAGNCMVVDFGEEYEACQYRYDEPAVEQGPGAVTRLLDGVRSSLNGHESIFCNPVVVTSTAKKKIELPRFSNISVYPPGVQVRLDNTAEQKDEVTVYERYDRSGVRSLQGAGGLLGVFLMDEEGRQVLPVFFFAENNLRPTSYNLAHRDYFRRVRDRNGWNIDLGTPASSNDNFYIQRLLNLNTGTRGTTIGMPLARQDMDGPDHFIGADIVLPALSLHEWFDAEALQDMVVMVIDRVSGQVLYHMDDKRSMVENLYHAGRGTVEVSQSIREGRYGTRPGYYHGKSGLFVTGALPISQWATVVFVPDASTDSLMTNTFLVSAIGMGVALLLLAGVLGLARRAIDTDSRKYEWGIPAALNGHGLMLFTSILVGSVYLVYWLVEVVGNQLGLDGHSTLSVFSIVIAMLVVLSWGYAVFRRLQSNDRQTADLRKRAPRGITALLVVYVVTGLGMTVYLHHVGNKPDRGLSWYYRNLAVARLNREKAELHEIALTRYPNTIKAHAGDPLRFVPISDRWYSCLDRPDYWSGRGAFTETRRKEPDVMPEDLGTFSQYTASTDPLSWVRRYLLTGTPDPMSPVVCPPVPPGELERTAVAGNESRPAIVRFLVVILGAFALLCAGWYLFYRRVLGARLFGAVGLTEHLRHIVEQNVPERAYAPRQGLVLDLHCQRHAGEDFVALLNRCANNIDRESLPDATCRGMQLILDACPWLPREAADTDPFPGARIGFELLKREIRSDDGTTSERELVAIHLSDLDVCLSQSSVRQSLLRLLRQLKVLYLGGQLSEVTLHLGFHSYESLLLKAHNTDSEREPMSETEFADWAETLMDFRVDLPGELVRQCDEDFVRFECRGSGLLRRLESELLDEIAEARETAEVAEQGGADITWRRKRRWLHLDDVDKSGREWATVNCILLKAGALFRHKWETCSSAEKLALYYLARRKRLNSANAQLLEQMSLQGLIRVDHGGVRIVNNTLAYFARHAEDATTLKDLVEAGEEGTWQEFRVPVTLVILALLGGVAFTSGSSMYMIIASLLGLLGTIGSLTSSARMIKENLR